MKPATTYVEAALREQGEHSIRVGAPLSAAPAHGRADAAARKRATRAGRRRGCYVYITAEQLHAAGIDPYDEAPWYRLWAGERGRFVVTLYREP